MEEALAIHQGIENHQEFVLRDEQLEQAITIGAESPPMIAARIRGSLAELTHAQGDITQSWALSMPP